MRDYQEEGAALDFSEMLHVAMEEPGVTRAELACRLGTSQAYITRVLGGRANFTLKTMAKLAHALGLQLEVGLAPQKLPSAAASANAEDTLQRRTFAGADGRALPPPSPYIRHVVGRPLPG